jgi:ubiquinone/menaquinone biosynthesis C-methylase UbiE
MSLQAKMFNRKAANPKNKPDQILETLGLQPRQNVADIGAGGGYFSLRFAELVGREGKVFAVDTNSGFLEFIKNSAEEKGLVNVETVLVTEKGLTLPENVDLVFMRNMCHHIPNRLEYFRKLKDFLKAGGRIAIVEYRSAKRFSFRGMFGHYVSKEIIVKEMNEAGYRLQEDLDFLPEQSFTIFSLHK